MTSDVTISNALQSANRTQKQSDQLAEDFSQFLTLLTTQIQNQDPLDPMDSKEFTNQLVQFSQVEQAINTNQKLDNMVQSQLTNAVSASLGFVGLDVTYRSAELYFDGESPVNISYALEEQAVNAQINIRDGDGNLVYNQQVPGDVGNHTLQWDGSRLGGGAVDPGTYSLSIDALNAEDEALAASTVVDGRVKGVETQDGIPHVLVGDRAVAVNNIINAKEPELLPSSEDGGEGEVTPPEEA